MGRPAKYSADDILTTATQLVAAHGPTGASVAAIARTLGAPIGSIYHRFESRDLLMAKMWIRLVRASQAGLEAKLALPDVHEAAYAGALHLPEWCRRNLVDAKVILMYRREQLAETWPEELGKELAVLNEPLQRVVRAFTARLTGRATQAKRDTVRFVVIEVPYAAVRRHVLAGKRPPAAIDDRIRRVCDALLFDE